MTKDNLTTQTWCFVLGRETLLSAAEIAAFFATNNIPYKFTTAGQKNEKYLYLETTELLEAEKIIKQLGGTVKIGQKVEGGTTAVNSVINYLLKLPPDEKIIFSINGADKQSGLRIKKILKEKNRKVRYVEPKNTATIVHNKLIEKGGDFEIINNEVFATVAVQPFETYGSRDYDKPGRDDVSGMLPPKLAMMMINLAQITDKNSTILDPFCGSGTIITEAILLGYTNLIGTDISEKAIEDTKKNVEWIKTVIARSVAPKGPPLGAIPSLALLTGGSPRHPSSHFVRSGLLGMTVKQTDIKNLNKEIKNKTIDAIITEPFLGKPLKGYEDIEDIKKQAEELKTLYLEAFTQFKKILKPHGTVVFIIPRFNLKNQTIKIDCLPEIKKLGFAPNPLLPDHDFLLYQRPGQYVGREVWRFTL